MKDSSNNLVLSCQVPDNVAPGMTFYVTLNTENSNRYFEVLCPDGAKPLDIIHVIVPSKSSITKNNSSSDSIVEVKNSRKLCLSNVLYDIISYIFKRSHLLNSQFKLMDKIHIITYPVLSRVNEINIHFKLQETLTKQFMNLDKKYSLSIMYHSLLTLLFNIASILDSAFLAMVLQFLFKVSITFDQFFYISELIAYVISLELSLVIYLFRNYLPQNINNKS